MSAQPLQGEGSKNLLQLPCLGSPFKLGMLYDCRTNKLIPGMTLWSSETLSKVSLMEHETCRFHVTSEDTFIEKALQLEASAGLQLALLSGLMQAEGAAKFLYDRTTSKNMARVVLSYKSTTMFEQLTMDQLGKVEFTQVFDKDMATHVVTGVQYGADAFFVFDQNIGKDQDLKKVQANIDLKIKSLLSPSVSIEASNGKASLLAKDEADKKKLTCRFHGDVVLSSHPTTIEDAVKVYQQLPKLLKGKGVAKKVWMHPLADLDGRAPRFVREVSNMLFHKIQDLLEFMHEVEVQTNDLIQTDASLCFMGFKKGLLSLKKLIDTYKLSVKTNVATLLPQIRAGKVTEAKLEDITKQNSLSPFSQECLSSLINEKEKEIRHLEEFLKFLKKQKGIEFAFKDGELDTILNGDGVCGMVCFDFNIHWENDASLKTMEAYLDSKKETQEKPRGYTPNPWYTGHTLETIQKQMHLFAGHVAANYGRQCGMKYVVTNGHSKLAKETVDEVAVISLCQNSSITRFDPLGRPGKPRAEKVNGDSVLLVWELPKQGSADITGFSIYCSTTLNNWYRIEHSQSDRNDFQTERFLVGKLLPSTTYYFKVCTENDKGMSPCSYRSNSIETEPPTALKEKFQPQSKKIQEESPIAVYELATNLTFQSESVEKKDVVSSACTSSAVSSSCTLVQQKVLMLVGATGAGKTTLINGIANYIMGVEWEDDFRFKMITEKQSSDQTKSQTKVITAYTFYMEQGFPFPYSLTIVDTPGFGDVEGLERDKKNHSTNQGILQ